jgi:hypothetical protein
MGTDMGMGITILGMANIPMEEQHQNEDNPVG